MALGKLFEYQNKKIIPKDDCYHIMPIKEVFDKFPDEHLKLCAYLHYMNSMKKEDNPYADVDLDQRSDQIVSDLRIEADTEDPLIIRALSCVEDKYFTTFYGIYKGLKTAMDNFGKELSTTKIDFSSRDGNANAIMSFAKNYEQLRNSFKAAYRDFDEETGNVRIRGNSKLGIDENDEEDDL